MLRRSEPAGESMLYAGAQRRDSSYLHAGRPARTHVAVLVKNFQYGGTQRVLLRIANKLNEYGHRVQIVSGGSGPLRGTVRSDIELIQLAPKSLPLAGRLHALRSNPTAARELLFPVVLPIYSLKGLPLLKPLANYLAEAQPGVLISATANLNIVAALARRRAGVDTGLIVTEHVSLDQRRIGDRRWARRRLPDLMRTAYSEAAAVVGVSSGVAADLRALLCVPEERVRCIYNPAVPDDISQLTRAPVEHPWFDVEQPPVVLSAGRTGRTKDYATLIHAFARVRAQRRARLVLLSSGARGSPQAKQLAELRELANSLGIGEDFAIFDFTPNPFRYMARAGVFVSSSTTEGFGNVVAEALACGCPVVSTQTEGPAEVLQNGRYGRLVPVGDEVAMAKALLETLRAPRNSAELALRAGAFTEERAGRAYEALCCEVSAVAAPEIPRAVHARTTG